MFGNVDDTLIKNTRKEEDSY